jgi:TonB family protein
VVLKKTAVLAALLGCTACLLTMVSLRPVTSLAQATCAQPFREAVVTKPQAPIYPQSAKALNLGLLSSVVEVTVDATGKVAAASIYKSSGNAAVDESALQAANATSYAPKLVNCQAVAGRYLFKALFEPDSYAAIDSDIPRRETGKWENPFCGASAIVLPWNAKANVASVGASQTYAVYIWTNATSNYAARLTLVSRDAAYAVAIPRTQAPKGSDARSRRSAYLVTLPQKAEIDEYFVDAVGVDGAAITDCPSFVKDVEGEIGSDASVVAPPAAFDSLDAQFAQALTAPACGSRFTPLTLSKFAPTIMGRYGGEQKVVEIEAFVDSAGHVIKTEIWRSSGVAGLDDTAMAQFGQSSYQPATFLCTPVVSSGIFAVRYEP